MRVLLLLLAGCAAQPKIARPPPTLALDEEGARLQKAAENWHTTSSYPPQVNPESEQRYAIPLGDSPARGNENALVTLVEFGDFRCQFTQRVEATLEELQKKYGADLRVVWKNQPHASGGAGRLMAHAVECARDQNRFWEMHDALFGVSRADEDAVREIEPLAQRLVPNLARWQACYRDKKDVARINRDQALARQLHAIGTPSFFINGRFVLGAKPLEHFVALIDEELKQARASGLTGSEYYARFVLMDGMSPADADRDLQIGTREMTAEEMKAEQVSRPELDIGTGLRRQLGKDGRDLDYRICVNRWGHAEQVTPMSLLEGGYLITRQIYERWQWKPRADKVCYREILHLQ